MNDESPAANREPSRTRGTKACDLPRESDSLDIFAHLVPLDGTTREFQSLALEIVPTISEILLAHYRKWAAPRQPEALRQLSVSLIAAIAPFVRAADAVNDERLPNA